MYGYTGMDNLFCAGKYKPIWITLLGLTGFICIEIGFNLFWMISSGEACGLQYFWFNDTDIPSEFITNNFSPSHISWLISVPVFIWLVLLLYRRQTETTRNRILQVLAVVILSSEASVRIWQIIIGHYTLRNTLPLHLCSISIFIEAAAVFCRRSGLLKEFSYALSMPAALSAVITPGWYYPFISFSYLQSMLVHSLLVLIPVLIVWGNGFRPNFRRLPACLMLLLFLAGIAETANLLFGGNYMFLEYVPKDTTLQVFELWLGHPGYIFLEAGVILVLWIIMYLPWMIHNHKEKKKKSSFTAL